VSVTIPMANQRWPKFRLLTRPTWGGTSTSGGGWAMEVMQTPNPLVSGFILLHYTRCLLPQIGNAEFIFRFGMFGDNLVGASTASKARMRQGEAWDPTVDSLTIPDLTGQEIRIQAAYPDEEGVVADADWATVWWGTCEYQVDEGWGAATLPSGERRYVCADAFARTRRWFMDKHGFISSAGTIAPAAGHPGYNVSKQSPSQVAGNRDSTSTFWDPNGDGVDARKFTLPGAGDTWTDAHAIDEALSAHRPINQPWWVLVGATDMLDTSSPWPVQEGDTVFDVVSRICNRARGRGACLPSWTEGLPTTELACTLTIFAQTYSDISYTDPAASVVTVNGANTNGTAINVDVIGDHRFLPESLNLGDPEQYRVDYLVSQGERIETLGTVEHTLTLEKGWDSGEQTAFLALTAPKRVSERWRPVYQLHRLKRGFQMNLGNGNGASQATADYRCTDAGVVTTDLQSNSIGNSAPSMIEVMDDLPLYEGYDYSSTPVRYDGQTDAAFSGTPVRRPPLLLIRTSSTGNGTFMRHSALDFHVHYKVMPDGFLLSCSQDKEDQELGTRLLGDTAVSGLASRATYDKIVMTLGFRLPHHVRMATGDPNGKRRLVINHPDIHLWLAAPTSIWNLDDTAPTTGGTFAPVYPALRTAGGTTPGILRDDRSALARLHAMAVAWYRPNLPGAPAAIVRNASWSLRCCGDIPSSTDYDGGGVVYPTCGKVVRYLYANGQQIELNTVVSSIAYDNTNGTWTVTTDWQDLDFSSGR